MGNTARRSEAEPDGTSERGDASGLSDQEKALALYDLIHSFRDEWVKVDGHWLEIDGSAIISDETARVIELMLTEARA